MKKRILSLILALAMVLTLLPAGALAVQTGLAPIESATAAVTTDGPMTLGETTLTQETVSTGVVSGSALQSATGENGELELYERQGVTAFSESEGYEAYAADETVTFIVVTEDAPLLKEFTVSEIAGQTAEVTAHQQAQTVTLDAVKARAVKLLGNDMELGYTYTIGTTGFSVKTAYGNMAALEAMEGVKSVYVAPTFDLPEDQGEQELSPMTANSKTMIGADIVNGSGYTGKGMRIAILDTGILETHPSFQALSEDKLEDPMTQESLEKVWDTLNASQRTNMLPLAYKSTKIPFAFNYESGTFDVSNTYAGSDHGTHVAGIAAANAVEGTEVVGVAPDAQLVVMQVFQNTGGANWGTIMAALEDCVRLEVDAANLSLGSAAGFTDPADDMLQTMQLFLDSDIEVLIASGNDTNNAYMNLWGGDMSLIENPDIGLTGTPGTYSSAITVASADNNGSILLYFTVNGTDYGFQDTATTLETGFIHNFLGQTLEYVMVPGVGAEEDYEGLDVTGKIAVISRGTTSFPEKQATAQAMGAIGCVIYNNTAGHFLMQINDGNGSIPCVSVTAATGAAMAEAVDENSVGTLTVCNADTKKFTAETMMSDFSSWGVTPDLKLKPEITGVGGNMYSATDPAISGSYYGYMSGTSMATPQITGAMAVLLEYLEETYPQLTGSDLRQTAANILMSTASPVIHANGLEYSPRDQGAGLADLVAATTAQSYLSNPAASESRPKAELGDDPGRSGVYEFTFSVTNLADEDRTFAFSSSLLTETIVSEMFIGNEPSALEAQVEILAEGDGSVLCYDFNDDGAITTADARVILRHISGGLLMDESNVHYAYLDVNSDGTVDESDAKVITDHCAELKVSVDLEAKTAMPVNQIQVGAWETVELHARIVLTETDKAYLEQFPNGMYVEGFLYAEEVGLDEENVEPARLVMPILGFYGDWSDADVFDRDDRGSYSLYPNYMMAYYSDVGYNPYFRNGRSGDEYGYISYANTLYEWDFGQLRNAKKMVFTVTDNETGEVYHTLEGSYLTKTFYSASYGMIIPTYLEAGYGELWDGKTADGKTLPDGTSVTYSATAWLDDGDDIADDTMSVQLTLDNTAPVIHNAAELQESLIFDGERTYLKLRISENEELAAVAFLTADGRVMGKYELDSTPGEILEHTFDITGFSNSFTIIAADYACNETEIDAFLNLGEQNNARPEPQALSADRLYGCETYDGALVEAGWFSASKSDFSDYRNETFDSANRYYSAEYVNGYLIGQNANTGHLELITPSGSYWASQILTENNGTIGDPGVWVLYDMALDHSGTLAASYGVTSEAYGSDGLFAVGWAYKGDNDNNGKDDGYNALFHIKFTTYGYVSVNEVARITGTAEGGEILTLGITTEGEIYGIDVNGILYSLSKTAVWDDSIGSYGDYTIPVTEIGVTDFVYYPNYGGVNVIQSMGYDHNTGKMYWYAHSQVPSGAYYDNINVTYTVDLETGECTEVGTYGPGGQTCLFVPNDLQSDLFELGVEPTGMEISPSSSQMVEGQTSRLSINWKPWNAEPAEVTWSSSDESLATVDEYGFVTALTEGTVTISASAEMMLDGYWEVTDDDSWIWHDPAMGVKTVTAQVSIIRSEEALYGFAAADFKNTQNNSSWLTYSDKTPQQVTNLGKFQIGGEDAYWNGGTYYNGYVYTTLSTSFEQDGTIYQGTELYKSKVTEGATPAETVIGEPELVGFAENVAVTALGFDYNTGRMYCVENQYVGGLGIIDLDTGAVDMLGLPNGDLEGAVYLPAMCVTADGTIVVSDATENLYTIDPDTLTTRQIHQGSGEPSTAFYEAMAYDYNTGSIYWNACDGNSYSPLYLVRMPQTEWDMATVVDMGDVSSKQGTQQTVLFAIPESEPETQVLPVESIEILDGDALTGLQGGSLKLSTATVPARPTVQARTWSSSDESVVTVDRTGTVTYQGVGTATVTVSITNKDEEAYGGPFTDSIEVTVLESAGEFVAFLTNDEGGSSYYDFWIHGKDYDLRHTTVGESMIATYSLRTGTYYDGYFYAFNDKGQFLRINADVPSDYKVLGSANLDTTKYQVTGMAMDYTTGTMYGLTMPSNYDYTNWVSEEHPGALVTVDLDTGALTTVAELDFSTPVYALACDDDGVLYAAGGSFDLYANATVYTVDKESGALTPYTSIGGGVLTGSNYYGSMQYNTQMAYDFGTDRLYIYATVDDVYYYTSSGMYMIQLGDEPTSSYLDGISLDFGRGTLKYGSVYLGLLAFIPEDSEIPAAPVNGIILNKNVGRIPVNGTTQLTAAVRPSNAADTSVTWSSSDETVATVDQNGLVTGISAGKAVITVTSNQTGITNECAITIVELEGSQSTAYTVSAKRDSLIKFNPALPAQTAEVVTTLSGGSSIKGMCAGDGCIYYITDTNYSYYLYRFDILTQQTTLLGQLGCFTVPSGIAYDPTEGLIYVTAGFYIFQFDLSKLDPANYNSYTNYIMDSDYCTLAGVVSIDGAIYTVGNDYYSSIPQLMKYSDKYLNDRTVLLEGFDISLVDGATDFSYDPSTDLFYLTDAGHNIYTLDWDGTVEAVDMLGSGIDMNGLAIFPAE